MAKRFKLRIPTFNSCRSKHPSSAPLSPTRRHHNHNLTTTTVPPQPHLYRSKSTSSAKPRHHSTSSSNPREAQDKHGGLHRTRSLAEFRWRKEDRWLVITKINLHQLSPTTTPRRRKIDDGDEDFVVEPSRMRRMQRSTIQIRLSTSSTESSNLFTTTSNRTAAAGDSSLGSSFSTDSSLESTKSKSGTILASSTTKFEKLIRSSSMRQTSSSSSSESDEEEEVTAAARLSVFKRLIPCGTLEGSAAVRESLAVVKRSEDPYEDFRRSMMEMVLEKHLFEVADLERVLQILLSLNSKRHHGVIVEAFEEIKEALFCGSSRRCSIDEFLR
ncbi:hypothetical protein Drorol1_Dr00011084 [Drosera rotundifolia]